MIYKNKNFPSKIIVHVYARLPMRDYYTFIVHLLLFEPDIHSTINKCINDN